MAGCGAGIMLGGTGTVMPGPSGISGTTITLLTQ
jgi:hypothetical protein